MSEDDYEPADNEPLARRPHEIAPSELVDGLARLTFFSDNMFLRTQALNLTIVDQFIMKLESSTLRQSFSDDRVSFEDSLFLSAQTQMWIFAAYELLRTWRGRAKKLIALSKTGGLDAKIAALNGEQKHAPVGNLIYAKQLAAVKADPKLVDQIDHDVDLTHVTFGLLSYVRVALAKHETEGSRTGKPSGSSSMGRADRYTGSVQYELTNGPSIWGYVSRRDIAEGIRGFATAIAQSKQELAEFDAYIRGPGPMPDFGGVA